jgi:hypothetical protein
MPKKIRIPMTWVFFIPVLSIVIGATAPQAKAAPITLTFGSLFNGVNIDNYFDGGLSSFPASGTGPNDGVVFSSNANEQRAGTNGHAPSGGTGRFENNPSGLNGVLYFPFSTTTTSFLNDAAGFSQISFGYSLLNNSNSFDDTVSIYSGLNGTGSLLASILLVPNKTTVGCVTTGDEFCTWSTASAGNYGDAESVLFGGKSSSPLVGLEFDDVQLTPTPLPASLPLLAAGLAAIGLLAWRSKRMLVA